MADSVPGNSSKNFSDYVVTHCTTCAAGWTRRDERGEMVIVCLLDREPVWRDTAYCNRYEPETAPAPIG